jgi:hypothetical protein
MGEFIGIQRRNSGRKLRENSEKTQRTLRELSEKNRETSR